MSANIRYLLWNGQMGFCSEWMSLHSSLVVVTCSCWCFWKVLNVEDTNGIFVVVRDITEHTTWGRVSSVNKKPSHANWLWYFKSLRWDNHCCWTHSEESWKEWDQTICMSQHLWMLIKHTHIVVHRWQCMWSSNTDNQNMFTSQKYQFAIFERLCFIIVSVLCVCVCVFGLNWIEWHKQHN